MCLTLTDIHTGNPILLNDVVITCNDSDKYINYFYFILHTFINIFLHITEESDRVQHITTLT